MSPSDPGSGAASVIVFLLGVLLFASPLTEWWAQQTPPWYAPYALWLGLVGLIWLVLRRLGWHDL